MNTTATTTTTGPITHADVRAALGDTDPSSTNAAKLQKIIGRGSLATVQKHLDAIRAELVPAAPVAPGAAPAAPADAVAVIWGAAWAAAQALTLGRLETVTAERDAARALAETRAQDVAALAGEVDALAETTAEAKNTSATLLEGMQTFEGRATAEVAAHAAAIAAAQAEIEKLKTEATAAAELAKRDAQIERQSLQTTIDRLTDQVSDLKSLLARLTPANQ